MNVSLIVAMGMNGVIGHNGKLPWHLPGDLKHFKELTMGKPILMGRKTHESIGRALPGRRNLVLTRDMNYQADGIEIFHTVEGVMASVAETDELMVIGGSEIYQLMLPYADTIYLTLVMANVEGDTFFPAFIACERDGIDCGDTIAGEQFDYRFDTIHLAKRTS